MPRDLADGAGVPKRAGDGWHEAGHNVGGPRAMTNGAARESFGLVHYNPSKSSVRVTTFVSS